MSRESKGHSSASGPISGADDTWNGAAVDQAGPSPTLIPPDGLFEGQIAVVGETRIDGQVRGSLRGPGSLVLGPTAQIEGPIECETVHSQGRIMGPVVARSRAHLGAGAHFEGDLEAPTLEVDDDAIWNGEARVGLKRDPGQTAD